MHVIVKIGLEISLWSQSCSEEEEFLNWLDLSGDGSEVQFHEEGGESVSTNDDLSLGNDLSLFDVIGWDSLTFSEVYKLKDIGLECRYYNFNGFILFLIYSRNI